MNAAAPPAAPATADPPTADPPAVEAAAGQAHGDTASPVLGPDDLAEMIQAYSAVAERMQSSHEALQNEVLRLHRELATKNEQLARSKRLSALGEMAAGIAHEIRNPLAAIQLYVEMVTDDLHDLHADHQHPLAQPSAGESPASAATQLQRITTASDNTHKIASAVRGLSAIVNDVLSFARQIQPRVTPLDTRTLCDRLIDEQRPVLETHDIEVQLQLRTPILNADGDLLHQALLNLVRNAADAMAPRGGGTLTLTIESQSITVADTGPGLPDGVSDRIFNPFFTTRSTGTGTGLGLAIVHRIVDAHGGSISVHNHPTRGGAVFTLDLPTPATPSPTA